jgi:trehalose-phosphatase
MMMMTPDPSIAATSQGSTIRPHWSERLGELTPQVTRHSRILVASDFDGTLSPLVDHPGEAVLCPEAPAVLARLAAMHPHVMLAFLSGRSLADLASRLGPAMDHAILAGNHGLEIRGAHLDWIHPSAFTARPDLEGLIKRLATGIGDFAGVELEDKGASLTLHYRRMDARELPKLRAIVDALALPDEVRMHEGKKVFEFRPQVEWNKGYAMRRILTGIDLSDDAVVFLGDDATDEDVFRELGPTAITVHVGSASVPSHARLNANDPADAVHFLDVLASFACNP